MKRGVAYILVVIAAACEFLARYLMKGRISSGKRELQFLERTSGSIKDLETLAEKFSMLLYRTGAPRAATLAAASSRRTVSR